MPETKSENPAVPGGIQIGEQYLFVREAQKGTMSELVMDVVKEGGVR